MARTRRSVELSDTLWATLEQMAHDMSVDVDALMNQAVFTWARLNGYVTPGPLGGGARVARDLAAAPAVSLDDGPPVPWVPPSADDGVPMAGLEPKSDAPAGPAEPGLLADPTVVEVRAERVGDEVRGHVQLIDAAGRVVVVVDVGDGADEVSLAPLLVDELKDASFWLRQHQQLHAQGRVGAATLALVRAVGAGAAGSTLVTWLKGHALPVAPEVAAARAARLEAALAEHEPSDASAARAAVVLDAIAQGAHAAAALRELAVDQHQHASTKVAADVIRCCKALDPDHRGDYAYTQAVVEMSLGRTDAVRIALDELARDDAAQAEALRSTFAALYPTWDFWPAHDGLARLTLGPPAQGPLRDVATLRVAVQKAATRVTALREQLKERAPKGAAWLPPELNHLLPKGPLPLTGDDAPPLERWASASVPELLRALRGEWAGLCWLCWLSGLDVVALPGRTAKPRSSTALRYALGLREMALDLAVADDQLDAHLEGQSLADAQRVAALPWLGGALDVLPRTTAEIALDEVRAAKLPVLWADERVRVSPWTPEAPEEEEPEASDEGADGGDEAEASDAEGGEGESAEGEGDGGEAQGGDAEEEGGDADGEGGDGDGDGADAEGEGDGAGPEAEEAEAPEEAELKAPPAKRQGSQHGKRRPSDRGAARVSELWLEREGHETVHLKGKRRFLVGRERTCDVVLASPRVSREHAELMLEDGGVVLNDLGSSNGTFFEGERITTRAVSDGDEVTFGNELVRFRLTEP